MSKSEIFINPLDKLRILLTEAGIPHENYKEKWPGQTLIGLGPSDMNQWLRNQVIYGENYDEEGNSVNWKFDAIYHFGANSDHHFLECWGTLIEDGPKSIGVKEAFNIIKADWEKSNGKS